MQDENDCDCDFSRILRERRRRSGLGCNQDCNSVRVDCNWSKVWLDTGTMIQPLEVAEIGSKSVRDDARGWTGRSKPLRGIEGTVEGNGG